MTTVYFPENLHPESLALIQVRDSISLGWLHLIEGALDVARILLNYGGVQAFGIVLKGKLRPGRTRKDPKDPTALRYNVDEKLRRVS